MAINWMNIDLLALDWSDISKLWKVAYTGQSINPVQLPWLERRDG